MTAKLSKRFYDVLGEDVRQARAAIGRAAHRAGPLDVRLLGHQLIGIAGLLIALRSHYAVIPSVARDLLTRSRASGSTSLAAIAP